MQVLRRELSKTKLLESLEGRGHFVQAAIHSGKYGIRFEVSGGIAPSGFYAGEYLNSFLDRGHRKDVKFSGGHGVNQVVAQHEVLDIFGRNHHPLPTRQSALHPANIIETLDL